MPFDLYMHTHTLSFTLQEFASLPSTNEYLRKQLTSNLLPEGFVVQASHQTSGRGQYGKEWQSSPGLNLLMSLLLKPGFLKAHQSFLLNMSICLALLRVLRNYDPHFILKWPNDLLWHQKKVAGILIENSITGGHLAHSIVGIGLNVNETHLNPVWHACSLAAITGRLHPLTPLRQEILNSISAYYARLQAQPARLKTEYCESLYAFRQTVPVRLNNRERAGQIRDLKEDGSLLWRWDSGAEQTLQFGDISFNRDTPPNSRP